MIRRRSFLTVAVFAIAVAAAAGQPGDNAASYVDRLEARAADASLSIREREAAADEAIIQRAALIGEAGPDHARRPEWCTTQASAVLTRLRRDGSDTAVLFGIPSPDQRERVRSAAAEAATQLERATVALRSRTESGAGGDFEVRIPFFRARAELLLAALATTEERARHAAAAFESSGRTGLSNAGPEAMRRVNVGASLLLRQPTPSRADAQLAIEEFAWAGVGGDNPERPDPAVAAATRVEGWLGLLHAARALGNLDAGAERLRGALREAPFTSGGRADPLFAVLAADALSRVYFEEGLVRRDPALLQRAASEQLALLNRTDLGFRAEALRPIALEKLAHLSDHAPADMPLPAGFELARAIRSARSPEARGHALASFRAIAARPDAGAFAGDALWELAVLLMQGAPAEEEPRRAIESLTAIARDHPTHARAPEAMEAALSYARTLPGGLDLYSAALTLATESFPELPEIDLWRYERGRLAVESASPAETRAALLSLRKLSRHTPDSVRLHERLQATAIDHLRSQVADARRKGDTQAIRAIASKQLEPEARLAVDWARRRSPELLPRFEADLADAMTDAGRTDGASHYAGLLRTPEHVPGGAPRLKLGRARAMLNSGQASHEAFMLLREAAAALDADQPAPAPKRADEFWHAWTLMLEILARESEQNQQKAGAIRAHIRRLESIDPGFGGEPWKGRIAAVRAAIAG